MSVWTHVAACVRVDYCSLFDPPGGFDFDSIFGLERPTISGSSCEVSEDFDNHPEKYLPAGSEGTLQKSVWEDPDTSNMARYTVSIFGDLRDHYDPDEIINWFRGRIENEEFSVRQAVITVRNSSYGIRTWVYVDDFDREYANRSEKYEVKYVD